MDADAQTRLCKCGAFFGTAAQNYLCSRCFQEFKKKGGETAVGAAASGAPDAPSSSSSSATTTAAAAVAAAAASAAPQPVSTQARPEQKNKNRCFKCNAKLTFAQQTTNLCKCDYTFCGLHLMAEAHDCVVDYKSQGRKKLEQSLTKMDGRAGNSVHRFDSCE